MAVRINSDRHDNTSTELKGNLDFVIVVAANDASAIKLDP